MATIFIVSHRHFRNVIFLFRSPCIPPLHASRLACSCSVFNIHQRFIKNHIAFMIMYFCSYFMRCCRFILLKNSIEQIENFRFDDKLRNKLDYALCKSTIITSIEEWGKKKKSVFSFLSNFITFVIFMTLQIESVFVYLLVPDDLKIE